MCIEEKYEKAKKILNNYNQNHIIKLLEKISDEKKEKLINQILNLDFKKIFEIYNTNKEAEKIKVSSLSPIISINKDKLSKSEIEELTKKGENIIKSNKYAVVTMSGGQGTRLGFNGPKGTFKIDVKPKPKYLFEIIVDNLLSVKEKYNVILPWYIMTSEENDQSIKDFFEENKYFGYDKKSVKFFKQGDLPLIDINGKLLVGEDYLIKEASNGNGSIFQAMDKNGVLKDMEEKNIEWVFIGSIDNVLLNMADPLLVGVAIDKNVDIATKSIFKNSPNERTGSLCKKDGKVKVIEYSELPEEMIEAVDENGELLYGESHVMLNLFSLNALKKIATKKLPYHKAFKKYNYIDEDGNLVVPEDKNAYKFEAFIFDSFEFFNDIAILRGKREEDFAPVKNAEGTDSPETAKKLYNDFWKKKNNK